MRKAVLIAAVAALCVAGSAMADGGLIGSGTRSEEGGGNVAPGQTIGSGGATSGQMLGSGGFTMTAQDQWMGNGGRAEDGQVMGSGALQAMDGGYLGSGNAVAVREIRMHDGSSLLVVTSRAGTFVLAIAE